MRQSIFAVIANTLLAFASFNQPCSLFSSKCTSAVSSLVTVSWLTVAFQRGQFGEERYEKEEFQRTVRATFLALMEEDKVFLFTVFCFCVLLEACPFLVSLFL